VCRGSEPPGGIVADVLGLPEETGGRRMRSQSALGTCSQQFPRMVSSSLMPSCDETECIRGQYFNFGGNIFAPPAHKPP